jgi:hypothetical protein
MQGNSADTDAKTTYKYNKKTSHFPNKKKLP